MLTCIANLEYRTLVTLQNTGGSLLYTSKKSDDCIVLASRWKLLALAQCAGTPALTRRQTSSTALETVATRHGRRLNDSPFDFRNARPTAWHATIAGDILVVMSGSLPRVTHHVHMNDCRCSCVHVLVAEEYIHVQTSARMEIAVRSVRHSS